MIETLKENIKNIIEGKYNITNVTVEDGKIENVDISVPLFVVSKQTKKNPKVVFDELEPVLKFEEIKEVNFLNGFLNINLDPKLVSKKVLESILEQKEEYGKSDINKLEIIVMDYSSPNIAKSFGVGHLRSTMIGNAIKNLYLKTGAKVVGINHLGDWGTQFGKMIVAYKKWGNEESIKKDPINELQKLYVRFHDEEKTNPELEQEGRDAFRKLELNDPEMIQLWNWFKDESLKEFMRVYERLNVTFDSYNGEAFYNDKMDAVVEELKEKNLLVEDAGATIVNLEAFNLPPALIKKSDGATLYMTRDLAAILYRAKTYNFTKVLYVVGNEQKLHFEQLKAVSKLMGYNFDIEHIGFGLVLVDGKKMSTRGGKFKRLEEVIEQAVLDAKAAITEKNPNLANKDKVAEAVGIGAIVFNDLKNDRNLNVDFNLDNMLKFEGQTGPYLQYSGVRIASILRENKLDNSKIDFNYFNETHYYDVVKLLSMFPQVIKRSCEQEFPSILAKYLLSLAQGFNHFYGRQKIVVEDINHLNTNLALIQSIRYVLNEGMRILGITYLDEM
ncbi:arginine--tRNA ligase [Haploplasma axanthum]|uniref:Arginine--tRNA ligase n=1 Tax=Haploplasma axanthum TaxID=29552 RepID=A0A449BF51_HAPAX|nr:arginine--tRNA ligase [Haploplasma axanthum]VEU81066.1 Arginyl-tRNA synthetase [Haploplasma axanthum]